MPTPRSIAIWDPLLRIFHWSVATLFLLNYWVLEAGEDAHEWVGYAIALLLAARLIWGFIGPRNARFASFWPTIPRLRTHWRQLREHRIDPAEGHNPAGALMILLLLVLLATTAVSGWMQGLDAFWGEDWVEILHEYSANALMAAVLVHITAVIVMGHLTGVALIRPMLTGRRLMPSKAE